MRVPLYFIILVFTLTGCDKIPEDVPDDNCQAFEYSDTYQYPIVPGTEDWKSLGSTVDKYTACLIPDQVLTTISTEGLLESLLNHPMIDFIFAFDNRQDGFDQSKTFIPGIGILYNKSDIFSVILDRYQKMDLDCKAYYPPYTDVLELAFPLFEIFLVQDEFIENLDSTEINLLFETVREVNLLKIDKRPDFWYVLESTVLMGKILLKVNYSPFVDFYNNNEDISRFIEKISSFGWDIHPRDTINTYAEAYYSLLH